RLVLLELGGDEALAPRDRLLTLEAVRHVRQVRARHLDVVAEHLVEADLERRDARGLALARLDAREVRPPVPPDRAQLVQLRVEPVAHDAALPEALRRSLDERLAQARGHVLAGVEPV